MRRTVLNTTLGLFLSVAAPGCAHKVETRGTHEATAPDTLTYTTQIDATRLVRGTGLPPVPASAKLIEENLASYFKVHEVPAQGDARREIVAEAPAPGYGVHVVVEERPDQYCFATLDIVAMKPDGTMTPVSLAPYSVHYGVDAARAAISSLRGSNRPPMTETQFAELRAEAAALAQHNGDQPIDDATFRRTPRPLEKLDDPRYYAPSQSTSSLRGE